MNHKLFGLLEQKVEAVLDITGEQVGGPGTEGVERKRLVNLL